MDSVTKAALYIRVSTEEQALEGQSVDAQIETLTQYCKLYNIEIYNIYKDLGVSGKSAKNRPGLQQMLNDASENKFHMIMVWKISRLSRSLKDLLLILDQLDKNNIVFTSYSERFDTSNAVGRMTLQLLGSIAEFERNTIIDNVKLGLREYARKGGKTGTILGYDNIDKHLIINQSEAAIVKLIYKLYVEDGMSMSDIVDFLNNCGYMTKRGKSFRKDSISVILGNPAYIGVNRHNIGTKEEYKTAGLHQAIIDTETFEAAQRLKQTNKRVHRKKNEESGFFLTGKLICKTCGCSMSGFSTKTASRSYRYYKCKNCGYLINASKLEENILSELEMLIKNNKELYDKFCSLHNPIKFYKKEEQLQGQINNLNSQLDKYIALLSIDELGSSKAILDKIIDLSEKIKMLQAEQLSLESKGNINEAEPACIQDRRQLLQLLRHSVKSINIDKKRNSICSFESFNFDL